MDRYFVMAIVGIVLFYGFIILVTLLNTQQP